MPHSLVSERQRGRAKSLRQKMTRAETLLWRYLKAHHVDGLGFRRQAPMGKYIVDFVCHDASLVVEVDGESHGFEERLQHDRIRDAWLASRGYLVVRFSNDDVLKNLEGVLTVIRETAAAQPPLTPLPNPPPQGGREQTGASRSTAINRKAGNPISSTSSAEPSASERRRESNS